MVNEMFSVYRVCHLILPNQEYMSVKYKLLPILSTIFHKKNVAVNFSVEHGER